MWGVAEATWQWRRNATERTESAGHTEVLVNLDESFIGFYCTDKKGYVVPEAVAGSSTVPPATQQVNLSKKRLGLTYVGLVAREFEYQHLLPQVIIGARQMFSRRTSLSINRALPSGYHFVVQPITRCRLLPMLLRQRLLPLHQLQRRHRHRTFRVNRTARRRTRLRHPARRPSLS